MNVIVFKLSHLKSLENYGHQAVLKLANYIERAVKL